MPRKPQPKPEGRPSGKTPAEAPAKVLSESITIRLQQLRPRLNQAANALDLSENDLARHAIRALVDCIEANNGRILWPPKFYVEGDKRHVKL